MIFNRCLPRNDGIEVDPLADGGIPPSQRTTNDYQDQRENLQQSGFSPFNGEPLGPERKLIARSIHKITVESTSPERKDAARRERLKPNQKRLGWVQTKTNHRRDNGCGRFAEKLMAALGRA
jgi:hypothetical protein